MKRRVLFIGCICYFLLVFVPFASVHWAFGDLVIRHLPAPIRSAVATRIARDALLNGPRLIRALRLDPMNKEAWNTYCDSFIRPASDEELEHRCQIAVDLEPTARNLQDSG